MDRAVTISQVAALAGVSTGTASKALNGRGALRPETRLRVQQAAEQLGFVANAAARSLQTGRTYTVGMITTDSIGRFSIPLLIGAEDALGAGQMSIFLCDARDDPIREQYYLRTLLSRKVDGIIVTGRRTQARAPIGVRLPVPVVYAFISSADPRDCSVVPDEADGSRRAIRHLLAIGRHRIALVTGPEHHHSATVRARAAEDTLTTEGLSPAAPTLYGEWSEAWGRQAAGILLSTGADVDAVFCGSDQIARGLAEALTKAGRVIPRDVALIGFDNWDVMVEGCQPPLTSIDMDLEGIGRTAAERLLAAINGTPAHGQHARPCRLVPRASTAV
ncbi:LacI family DNA-binding transcriptional regulator [Actinoplanes derwentensis]|uniref:Transcriptional regulator, LacI family n=1 Tax=Actinoplanes derwentensis TaxID=113562 RepID=A0A1H2DCV9_9ACTN|nr:LacI family DNA-binding transcriptional regulator [Actinoplanes derwentensis]GID90013.1 LacI family transcriptional regulator [Actinoplanes derwentensis]SDT80086.1 transcriptional regulator, LacI family [Actinoplanes derwentensis]